MLMLYGIHESLPGRDGVCHSQIAQPSCGNGTLSFLLLHWTSEDLGSTRTLKSPLIWACRAWWKSNHFCTPPLLWELRCPSRKQKSHKLEKSCSAAAFGQKAVKAQYIANFDLLVRLHHASSFTTSFVRFCKTPVFSDLTFPLWWQLICFQVCGPTHSSQ